MPTFIWFNLTSVQLLQLTSHMQLEQPGLLMPTLTTSLGVQAGGSRQDGLRKSIELHGFSLLIGEGSQDNVYSPPQI